MNLKLNIYQKEKNRILKKNILLSLLGSISVIAVMTFFFSILYPEDSKEDFILAMVGIWIIITIFCFSVDRWGNLGNILTAVICIVISLLFLAFFSYRCSIISEEGKKAIQETASYDAL